jgi:MYXO-CTERM domain-containing protein
VTLTAVAPALAGDDYHQNGAVDAADYVVWRKNEGTMNMLPNDPIGGTIGAAQYDQWRAHFGQTTGGAGSSIDSSLVAAPEPNGAALWLVALAGVTAVRNARRKIAA